MNALKLLSIYPKLLSISAAVAFSASAFAQNNIDVNVTRIGAPIQPTMYGIFFEDINFAADGGLYAELIKNRSFEFPGAFTGWTPFGNVQLKDDGPFERNPHYARLSNPGHAHKHTGLDNEGYFGIGVKKGETYRFSVWARVPNGGKGRISVNLVNTASMEERQQFCTQRVEIDSKEWKQYEVMLTPDRTDPKAKLRIFLETPEVTVDLEHVSLFPTDTWMGHRNGMRKDLAQALADLKPGIFRFPGGCIVEGTDLDTRYNWKNSVGPVENRPLNENRWEYTFNYRFFPDYFQSYGLGFYEFFQLSEEIGSEPLPIVSVGLACQFQNNDEHAHVPVGELQDYIQDALDLIEFANGPTTTEWGKLRADMGHPAPFNLKYIGIGNEQWGPEYPEHLEPFVKAVREKYPEIKIVGSSGPDSEGKQFDYLWPEMKRLGADLVDEHFYRPETWFLSQGGRYDNYDRKGPKVFAGEYACHGKGRKYNHFHASLLEAAFMTGLERNADIVHMATYAPLFAHVEGWQWRPDLIWYDNLESFRTASWHVQQIYSEYKGQNVLKTTMNGAFVNGSEAQDGLFASSVIDADKIYVKVVNTTDKPKDINVNFTMKKKQAVAGVKAVKFTSDKLYEDNSIEKPANVAPVTVPFSAEGTGFSATIEPYCFMTYVLDVVR